MSSDLPHLQHWFDYGLSGTPDPDPLDWRQGVLKDFGSQAENMGMIDGSSLNGLAAEVEYYVDANGDPRARTPMLELSTEDYRRYLQTGRPYHGMLALGDTGTVYGYDQNLGFFKKLWSAAKKLGKRIVKGAKKFIKRLPGGKYLIRLGEKIWKTAMKLVKPLARFVGKYAAKLAPVAALIPGFGPAVAAGLYTAGKVANLMKKYGISTIGDKGKARKLASRNPKKFKKFEKAIKRAAKRERLRQRRGGKIKPLKKARITPAIQRARAAKIQQVRRARQVLTRGRRGRRARPARSFARRF